MKIIVDDIDKIKCKFNEQNKEKLLKYRKNKRKFYLFSVLGIITCMGAVLLSGISTILVIMATLIGSCFIAIAVILKLYSENNPSKTIKKNEGKLASFCEFLKDIKKGNVILYDYDYDCEPDCDDIVFFYYNRFDNEKILHQINCPISLTEVDADGYEYSAKETIFDFTNFVCIYGNEEVNFFNNFMKYHAEELYTMLVNNGFWEGVTEPEITEMKEKLTVEEREKLTKSLTDLQKDMQEILFH